VQTSNPCKARAAIAAVLAILLVAALAAAPAAQAKLLEPPGKKVWFGVSDTGDMADFGHFSDSVDKHPAVIESFRTWGSEFPDSIQRWQTARARPMIHITTADNNDGHELISLAQIARGDGDGYLVRLNNLFAAKHMRAYVRPLGEPNRCLNVYAAYDCAGKPRGPEDSAAQYRRAFRRIYVIVHGGGKKAAIDKRLAEAGLPRLRADVGGLPKAPVAIVWSPHPSGDPTLPPQPPPPLLPRLALGRLGRDRLLLRLPGMEVADRPLPALLEQALRDHRVGRRKRRRPELRQAPLRLGEAPPANQDAGLLPGLRLDQHLPDPELLLEPQRPPRPPPLRPFPFICTGRASPTAATPRWGCSAVMLE
jgi:hypothetical protein